MKIQNINNELTITIPNGIVDIVEIQHFLDYLRYKSIVNKSQATEEDIEQIAEEINESWWVKNKKLYQGLRAKGFLDIVNTSDLLAILQP